MPPIIAEDLGMLTPAVHRLLKNSGYPGMKVLQFAFNASEESTYLPHNLPNHCVVYTGTHDNDTTRGWLDCASPEDLEFAMEYLGLEDLKEGNWAFIRAALSSVADWQSSPPPGLLGLGVRGPDKHPFHRGGDQLAVADGKRLHHQKTCQENGPAGHHLRPRPGVRGKQPCGCVMNWNRRWACVFPKA